MNSIVELFDVVLLVLFRAIFFLPDLIFDNAAFPSFDEFFI